jgi:hypothetical protein
MEASLRPSNDPPSGEFDEEWGVLTQLTGGNAAFKVKSSSGGAGGRPGASTLSRRAAGEQERERHKRALEEVDYTTLPLNPQKILQVRQTVATGLSSGYKRSFPRPKPGETRGVRCYAETKAAEDAAVAGAVASSGASPISLSQTEGGGGAAQGGPNRSLGGGVAQTNTQLQQQQPPGVLLPPGLSISSAPAAHAEVSSTTAMGGVHHGRGRTICIWDLDETLVVLQSLLTGRGLADKTYAGTRQALPTPAAAERHEIGAEMQELLLEILEGSMFHDQLDGVAVSSNSTSNIRQGQGQVSTVTHLGACEYCDDGKDLSGHDFTSDGFHVTVARDGKPIVPQGEMLRLAYRYRKISEDYAQRRVLGHNKAWHEQAVRLSNEIDRLCGGRLRCARETLRATTRGHAPVVPPGISMAGSASSSAVEVINVVLSELPLCSSLAQCVVWGLEDDILAGNVYSSWQSTTATVLQQIKARFGASEGTSFVCVQRVGAAAGPHGGLTGAHVSVRATELTEACRSVSLHLREHLTPTAYLLLKAETGLCCVCVYARSSCG